MKLTAEERARATELVAELEAKHKRSAELSAELGRSLEIQAIWPDAFKGGQTCSVGGRGSYDGRAKDRVIDQWLQRADGERFPITLEQFKHLRRPKT